MSCSVLGIDLLNYALKDSVLREDEGTAEGTVNGFATSVGFTVSIVILAGIREKMEYNNVPKAFKGMPIVLVSAGLMAIAFCGFAGLL